MDERAIARGMRPNHHPLDEDSASRMLQGTVHPDDAPPGYASVSDLLASAAHLPAVDEDAAASTVSAMVEAVRGTTPVPERLRRRSMIGKLFAGKVLAAVATVALTATGAAAATGTLPSPVQGAVAGAVSHIGIDLSDDHGAGSHGDDPASLDTSDDHGDTPGGTTEGQEGAANDDHGQGAVVSGITHDPALDGQPKGPAVCAAASDGKCQAGDDHSNSGPGKGNGEDHRSPGDNSGSGNTHPGSDTGGSSHEGADGPADHPAADDPAGHDADTDHGGAQTGDGTTSTTAAAAPSSPTSTTADDHGGSHGSSSKGGSGGEHGGGH